MKQRFEATSAETPEARGDRSSLRPATAQRPLLGASSPSAGVIDQRAARAPSAANCRCEAEMDPSLRGTQSLKRVDQLFGEAPESAVYAGCSLREAQRRVWPQYGPRTFSIAMPPGWPHASGTISAER